MAREMIDQSFMMFAKLKVKGHNSGFLDPIVEIPCAEETIHAGLFSLGAYNSHQFHRFKTTKGILVRSINESNSRAWDRGKVMGLQTRKAGGDEVEGSAKKQTLTDGDKAEKNTTNSDIKGRHKLGRKTSEEIFTFTESGESGLPRKSKSAS